MTLYLNSWILLIGLTLSSLYTLNDLAVFFNGALLSVINKFVFIKQILPPKSPHCMSYEFESLIY